MLYGTILPSGADAALGLAEYCCGSQEAFVEEMNKKVEELGLSETAHFTNVVGVYNEDLHCTMKDMAVILSMAIQDDLLLDVLSKRKYNTDIKYGVDENGDPIEATLNDAGEMVPYEGPSFPDGIEVSNWFLRRIEDKEMDGDVIAAKTGFVNEAGCCACSYYEADNGKRYICVTGNSFSSWRTIYDHVSIYRSLTD
jgi:D-alanyl-D-alanine carboxypeptidase